MHRVWRERADHLAGARRTRVAPVLAREPHDHLAGRDHLAGLGAHRSDDALGIGSSSV